MLLVYPQMQEKRYHKTPKIDKSYCLYQSSITIVPCFEFTVIIAFVLIPILWINISRYVYYSTVCFLSLITWIHGLQRNLFYNNCLVVYFPLRLFRRKILINYKDIENFTYKLPRIGDDFIQTKIKNKSKFFQWFVYSICAGLVYNYSSKNRKKTYYLLKFIKSKGIPIKICGQSESDYEKKLKRMFGEFEE